MVITAPAARRTAPARDLLQLNFLVILHTEHAGETSMLVNVNDDTNRREGAKYE